MIPWDPEDRRARWDFTPRNITVAILRSFRTCPCFQGTSGDQMASRLPACLQTGEGLCCLLQFLDLTDCIRIACCSKAAHAVLQFQLSTGARHAARGMLVDRVKEAADYAVCSPYTGRCSILGLETAEQIQQEIHWLVEQAGPMNEIVRCSSDVKQFMSINKLPATVAAALVCNGFRFTYQQLLSAVQQHVQGVEVWVQAYRLLQLERPGGMPYLVEALCCNDKVARSKTTLCALSAQRLLEVMQVAVAMPPVGTSTSILEDICTSGAADQMTEHAVHLLVTAAVKAGHSNRVEILLKLPAACSLQQDQVLQLLQAATLANLTYSLQVLCRLPAAQSLHTEQVMGLLQTAVHAGDSGVVRVLCGLPAAQQLSAGVVQYLLQGVFGVCRHEQGTSCGMVWVLSQLPAALNDPGVVGAF